ncbi:MAG TPA: 16S rRNA (uracil(1498)-N(3))-methyltransferase [Anaerolineales bacterium]|nr:16S rRNA (uracil(1498)-N(3))-methyltransferase [Anaerolineales bacterium]
MSALRFFVPPSAIHKGEVHFPAEIARQMKHVLRLQSGTVLTVLDGSGQEYAAELRVLSSQHATAFITDSSPNPREPRTHLTLFQGLLKKDKFEWLLQKGTELGVSAFVPVQMARSVADAVSDSKFERWERIAQEAAEQCQRGKIPPIGEVLTFAEMCATWQGFDAVLIPSLKEDSRKPLALPLPQGGRIGVVVGAEGGFDPAELALAQQAGAIPITLGVRTLRAETAALAACTLVLAACGEL